MASLQLVVQKITTKIDQAWTFLSWDVPLHVVRDGEATSRKGIWVLDCDAWTNSHGRAKEFNLYDLQCDMTRWDMDIYKGGNWTGQDRTELDLKKVGSNDPSSLLRLDWNN